MIFWCISCSLCVWNKSQGHERNHSKTCSFNSAWAIFRQYRSVEPCSLLNVDRQEISHRIHKKPFLFPLFFTIDCFLLQFLLLRIFFMFFFSTSYVFLTLLIPMFIAWYESLRISIHNKRTIYITAVAVTKMWTNVLASHCFHLNFLFSVKVIFLAIANRSGFFSARFTLQCPSAKKTRQRQKYHRGIEIMV